MPVITIRGQYGSWPSEIGELIARKLDIDYVDREIIAKVAERLREPSYSIEEKEMPPSTLLGRIAEALSGAYISDSEYMGMYLPISKIPLNDIKFLSGLEHIIHEMAKSQAIVIRGRGSQFILRDWPGVFHVLTVAPFEVRVNRVMKTMNINEEEAKNEIARFDNGSREFVKRYFKSDMMDPVNYDIIINTNHFDVERAASVVVQALPKG